MRSAPHLIVRIAFYLFENFVCCKAGGVWHLKRSFSKMIGCTFRANDQSSNSHDHLRNSDGGSELLLVLQNTLSRNFR